MKDLIALIGIIILIMAIPTALSLASKFLGFFIALGLVIITPFMFYYVWKRL
jgi:hypothetical protein